MSITEVEDLTMFCRVCLQLPAESELLDLNLIYDEDEQLTYYDCFTMCTQIQISDGEGLPQNLCRSCGLELQMAYDFYKKVDESKRFLIQLQDQQTKALLPATEEEFDSTTPLLGEQEEIVEQEQEEEVVEEEHLDMEEYQAVEHLDEEDADTIQIKINTKSDDEEYIIEAITLADEEMEETVDKLKDRITWEEAVVAVANEQHLPVNTEIDTVKIEAEDKQDIGNDTNFMYEDEEVLEFENEDDTATEEIDNISSSEKNSPKLKTSSKKVGKKPTRFTGRFNCDVCEKAFPNHSRMMLHRNSHLLNRPKFPCQHCDRLYATKQAMDVHIRTVHLKNGFICPICSKLYVIKKSLEVHLRYHTGDFPYVCDLCGKKFAQIGHLNTHRNVKHNSVRFSCEYPSCGKFFTSSTSLRNHEFTHGEMPFQCSYCEKGYPSKSKLKVHIRRKHDMELTLEQLEPMQSDDKTHVLIKEEGSEEYGEETLVDDNEVTFYKEYIIEHITEEGEQENMQPKKEVIEKFSESENEVDEDEEFTFEDLYEKVFEDIKNEQIEKTEEHISTKKIRLKRRRRGRPRLDGRSEDEDDTDLMLDEIDAYDRQNQHTNKIQHNTSDEDRKCLEENEVAEESDAANAVRMKRKRRGPPFKNEQKGPPYECEICQAICKTRSLLNSHRFRKHRPQNEPRFSCSKCHRKFLTQQALEKHTRRPTCESYPQFDCEHCGKKCIGLSNYNIHLRFHKRQYPFVCHLCGKKFMMCVHLNEHVLVKHENKRYPCEHPGCGKLFQTRNSLYNHSYQHSGYMPFECEYCKRGYASKSRLRFHCKKSHNIDHSIEELDRMQVTEKLPNPVVKPQ